MDLIVPLLIAVIGAILVAVGAVVGQVVGAVVSAIVYALLVHYVTFMVFRKRGSLVTKGLDYAYQRFISGADLPQNWRELAGDLPWPPDVRDTFPLPAASWATLNARALKNDPRLRTGLEFARRVYPAGSGTLEQRSAVPDDSYQGFHDARRDLRVLCDWWGHVLSMPWLGRRLMRPLTDLDRQIIKVILSSTGHRNIRVQFICWRTKPQCFSRSLI